jgi:hypothetical protein
MTTGHTGVAGIESGTPPPAAPGGPSEQRAIELLSGARTMQGIAPVPAAPAPNMEMTVSEVTDQVAKIQQLMKDHLRKDEHYGVIPGTGKKQVLLKPGAEKLSFMFCLLPKYTTSERQLPNGHREFQVICDLFHVSGTFRGQGVGSCSTMEKKYRYRQAGMTCPSCGKVGTVLKSKMGPGWFCWNNPAKGKDGCGAKFPDGDRRIEGQDVKPQENPDLADTYNTVLKMAKKRAFVDGIITACAASDIFTQDIGDPENDDDDKPQAATLANDPHGPASPPPAQPRTAAPPPQQEFPASDAQIAKLRRLAKGNQMTFEELMAYQKYSDAQGNVRITKQQATALIDAMLKDGVVELWT